MSNTKDESCALYYEICILKKLMQMGYISEEAFSDISKLAAEDYNSMLILPQKTLCYF